MEEDVRSYVPPALLADVICPLMMHGATLEFVDLNVERLEVTAWNRVDAGARRVLVFGASGYGQTRNFRLQFEASGKGWHIEISSPKRMQWRRGEECAEVRFFASEGIRGVDADAILYAIRRESTRPPPRQRVPEWRGFGHREEPSHA